MAAGLGFSAYTFDSIILSLLFFIVFQAVVTANPSSCLVEELSFGPPYNVFKGKFRRLFSIRCTTHLFTTEPNFSDAYRISLNTMTLQVESPTVYTCQGVPISVTGIAQVNIAP